MLVAGASWLLVCFLPSCCHQRALAGGSTGFGIAVWRLAIWRGIHVPHSVGHSRVPSECGQKDSVCCPWTCYDVFSPCVCVWLFQICTGMLPTQHSDRMDTSLKWTMDWQCTLCPQDSCRAVEAALSQLSAGLGV